jgi:putative endopeptidase
MSETKKQRHKKGHMTRKLHETPRPKAIPPFPQVPPPQISKRPGQDFYLYVNNAWLHSVKTPSYRSAIGVSEELEEVIKENLLILIEKSIAFSKRGISPRSVYEKAFQLVGLFGLSALRPNVQANNIHLLKKMINDVNCMRSTDDVVRMLGTFVRFRITTVLSLYTYFEPGKTITSRCALSPGQLGLPDASYYLREGASSNVLAYYGKFLETLGKLLDLDLELSKVIGIEHMFAKELLKYQSQHDTIIEGGQLLTKFNGIHWDLFWETIGYDQWKTHTIKLNPPGWIKIIEHTLKHLPIEDWKLLLTVHLILHAVPLLPPPFDDIHSNFFEKYLRGQAKKLPQRELTTRLLQEWMPSTMSKLYLKYFIDSSLKKEATSFVKTIQIAAIDRIQRTDWFSASAKRNAIDKVKKMKMGVAYPSKLRTPTGFSLQSDNLFQNILLLGEDHTRDDLASVNHKVNIENEWDDAIYAVNAYYYSEVNQLVLPAGSLQWPFYHPDAPSGWNYGGLGAIVGHEMTHAFDSDGKEYDWEGKKKKWWTAQDNREYNKRTKALIRLFSQAKVLDHPVNGTLTLNENISDLGGLAIALDALQLECSKKQISPEERKKIYQNFFISYAVSWRIKEKPEKVIQGLFMDRHAPAPLRVNLIVSQFDEWYEAFDIEVQDKLYIPPEERIRIF